MTPPAVIVVAMTPEQLAALVREVVRAELRDAGPAAPSQLVAKQAAASALGISTATLDRLVRAGRVPYVLVGDSRRFDVAVVRAALAVEANAPTAESQRRATPIPGVRRLGAR